MTKIVINTCYGGFGLSKEALDHMRAHGSPIVFKEYGLGDRHYYGHSDLSRADPFLVAAVEALGIAAAGPYSDLKVVEIPSDVEWQIEDYDGVEWVSEKHRVWS